LGGEEATATGREEATVTGKNEAAVGGRGTHVWEEKGEKKRKYKFLTDK
jgi:hypothetical protein